MPLNLYCFLYLQAKCLDFSLVVIYLALLCAFLLWGLLHRTRGRTSVSLQTKPLRNSDNKSDLNKNGKSPHNSVQVIFCQIVFHGQSLLLTRIYLFVGFEYLCNSLEYLCIFWFLLACFSSLFFLRKMLALW